MKTADQLCELNIDETGTHPEKVFQPPINSQHPPQRDRSTLWSGSKCANRPFSSSTPPTPMASCLLKNSRTHPPTHDNPSMTSGSVRPEAREILTVSGILWEEISYGNKHNAVSNIHRPAQRHTDQILWLWSINTSSLSRSHVILWWHTSQASDCKWDPWSGFGSAPWPLVRRVLWRKARIFSDLFFILKFLCTNCH